MSWWPKRLTRNIYEDLGLKGSLILFGICFLGAAVVVLWVWPTFAGVCVWNLGGGC